MLYPILVLVCLLLRGHLSLQNTRKDSNLVVKNINDANDSINDSINSCSIEELSKLLTNKIAMTKALELLAQRESKTKEEMLQNILDLGINEESTHFDTNRESYSSKDNEIPKDINFPNSATTVSQNIGHHMSSELNIPGTFYPNFERESVKEATLKPMDSYSYSLPLFIPHRIPKPPLGAVIKIQFKGKIREVIITVSPLMSVLEGLKQAEIGFKRIFKNIPFDSNLISFWFSPTLGCIVVDKVSTVQNNKSMMWRLSVIDSNGEIEFEDFCLPANGQLFIKPGSTIQLVYTSLRDVKEIY